MSRQQPREHVRLLHAFNVPLTKPSTVAWTTGLLSLLGLATPAFFIPAAGVMLGVGGLSVNDRINIAKGLREVEVFGFPVEGYRAWLLADFPAFDIELKRSVDVEVVRTSTIAVDATIVVEKKAERVFRFVLRRIAFPNVQPHLPPIEVGDRRLLKELHRRILAPLHADVGIVRMQMGDNATLAPLVPAAHTDDEPASSVIGLGAFRESALAAPPALQALVHVGGERAMPHEARRLKMRPERVMHAANASPSGFGTVAALTFGGLCTGAQFGLAGVWAGIGSGFVTGIGVVISGNRRNLRMARNLVANRGFPIEDYEDWLLSGRPLFDIETTKPMIRDWLLVELGKLSAWSVQKQTMVSWVEDVTWFSEHEVRIETRPSYIQPPNRIEPFYGGSHEMFRRVLTDLLPIVHERFNIRSIKMGGYVDRRM
jgi:hypothetical protein